MDEVFGSENYCCIVSVKKTISSSSSLIPQITDYLLWSAKNKEQVKYRQPYRERTNEELKRGFQYIQKSNGEIHRITQYENIEKDDILFNNADLTSQGETRTGSLPYKFDKKIIFALKNRDIVYPQQQSCYLHKV